MFCAHVLRLEQEAISFCHLANIHWVDTEEKASRLLFLRKSRPQTLSKDPQ